jgi:hypothetical protein
MKPQTMHKNPMNHKVLNEERENKLAKQAEERRRFRDMMKRRCKK